MSETGREAAASQLAGLSDEQLAQLVSFLEPIAPNQVRLWVAQDLEPDSNAYNVARVLRLRGHLDVDALVRAVGALVARHELLRTVFLEHGNEVYQVVLDPAAVQVRTLPVTGEGVDAMARQFTLRPFDLRSETPFRAEVVRVSAHDHALLFCFHHIATDGWSLDIFERELADAYAAITATGSWQPDKEATQYSRFARWQRMRLTSDVEERQLAYWRAVLPAEPQPPSLLATRPLQGIGAGPSRKYVCDVPADVCAAIGSLSAAFDVTSFAVLQTAVQAVVQRYSAHPAVVLGTTTLNRKKPEFESSLGFFVNTIPLHTDLSDNPSFGTALRRSKQALTGALSHDDIPFHRIVGDVHGQSAHERATLFRVVVELQPIVASGERRWRDIATELTGFDDKGAKFDLALFFLNSSESLRLLTEYDSALFDEAMVTGLVRALFTLIVSGANDPDTTIDDLDLLDQDSARMMRTIRCGAPPPEVPPVSDVIRELSRQHGPRTAIQAHDGELTFSELVCRAEAVADALIARGLRPGTFVGVAANRSVHSIVAVLGVWLARCAYVPIDPALPAERKRQMISDARVQVVVEPASTSDCDVLDVRDLSDNGRHDVPARTTEPEDIAYAMFTSGTTGKPKAVLVTHANLANLISGLKEAWDVTDWSTEVVSLNAPLVFDASVQQLVALLGGATMVIVPEAVRLDPEAMLDHLAQSAVTLLDCVPSHLQLLVENGLLTRTDLALRRIATGGEALPAQMWEPLAQARHIRVYNVYGPTETTVDATCQPVHAGVARPAIGVEMPGVSLFIADGRQRLVPYGAVGELYIGGMGVGAGYLNEPELTATRFVDVPWGPDGELVRVYRTGDKVRLCQGGAVEYLGRHDNQVKVRGQRVELGEIDATLDSHPSVHAAVTLAVDDGERGVSLHAFVIVGGEGVDDESLRQHLFDALPEHMVPAHIHRLRRFPETAAGKVDHAALRRLAHATAPPPTPELASHTPADPVERQLVDAWREVLGIAELTVNSHFFAMGGHSVLAARLIARLRRVFDVPITFGHLLRTPTPRGLAAHLRSSGSGKATRSRTRRRHVVELADAPDDAPIVCLHPLGGDANVYRPFVSALPMLKTVYGVFDGLTDVGSRTTWPTPEDMVRGYVDEIIGVLDGRPCHLVGWSMGGLLAHAVAGELEERGVAVLSVSLWDCGFSPKLGTRPSTPDWMEGAVPVLASLVPDGAGKVDLRATLRAHAGPSGQHLGQWVSSAATSLWGDRITVDTDVLEDRVVVAALHRHLFAGWRPGVVTAPLSVAWAGHSLDNSLITQVDWSVHTKSRIDERRVEGTHYSIVRPPNVAQLADMVADALGVRPTVRTSRGAR